jgi:hypothetical protein
MRYLAVMLAILFATHPVSLEAHINLDARVEHTDTVRYEGSTRSADLCRVLSSTVQFPDEPDLVVHMDPTGVTRHWRVRVHLVDENMSAQNIVRFPEGTIMDRILADIPRPTGMLCRVRTGEFIISIIRGSPITSSDSHQETLLNNLNWEFRDLDDTQ